MIILALLLSISYCAPKTMTKFTFIRFAFKLTPSQHIEKYCA